LSDGTTPIIANAMASSAGDRLSARNLLLVDDNDDVREITALLLRDSGYGVIEASNGIAAFAALDANPAIEVLIVDFSMPGMSGIELLERARAKRPEIRAVFITGYVDHTLLNGKFAAEIVVKKPFTMDQLAPAVRKALGESDV
jgi:CheY-like chemotaxis protein